MIVITPVAWYAAYVQIVQNDNPGGWWLFAFGTLSFVVGMWSLINMTELTDAERAVLVREIHGYAEGVDENLRDGWIHPEDPPEVFPVVEDYLGDADRIEAGEDPVHDTLEAIADRGGEQGEDEDLIAALAKFDIKMGYRGETS